MCVCVCFVCFAAFDVLYLSIEFFLRLCYLFLFVFQNLCQHVYSSLSLSFASLIRIASYHTREEEIHENEICINKATRKK